MAIDLPVVGGSVGDFSSGLLRQRVTELPERVRQPPPPPFLHCIARYHRGPKHRQSQLPGLPPPSLLPMALVPQSGQSSAMSREGSHTALVLQNPAEQRDASAPPAAAGTLCLRGGPLRNGPRVAWDEAVVDNEGLGRKKSKICCIYHRPRRFDESSDEEDEESSETDPSSDDNGTARPSGQYRRHRHRVDEERGRCREHKRLSDRDDHNAYERISPHKGKGKDKSN